MKQTQTYEALQRLTRQHFGRGAMRFIDKVLAIHLSKDPRDITKTDLVSMEAWIKNTLSFLVEDEQKINNYISELLAIAHGEEAAGVEEV